MKIGFMGVDLPEGKVRYEDAVLKALADKDEPRKVSPYFVELLRDELVQCDAIIVLKEQLLDLLILDMERVETRISRLTDEHERAVMARALSALEEEQPLCEGNWDHAERAIVATADPYSLKPVLPVSGSEEVTELITTALDRAGYTFFYTSGPKESHAWLVRRGATMLECAEKIHSDLARGFIRAEVVELDDYLGCHSFNECRSKGLVRELGREDPLGPRQVIEFKFNV